MSAFEKLGSALRDLQETLLSLAPGGLAHRSVSGSSPITPLFFFCAFTLLAAVSLGVFSDNCWLQLGAFSLFAATLVVGMVVYLGCLFKSRIYCGAKISRWRPTKPSMKKRRPFS